MGKMSKRKGAAGELEAARKLNEVLGTAFHRGRQYCGGPESPDITGDVPGLHVEVKRTEKLRLWEAVGQAREDASVDQVPVVLHRANHKPWVLIVEVDELIRLLDVVDEHRARLDQKLKAEIGKAEIEGSHKKAQNSHNEQLANQQGDEGGA